MGDIIKLTVALCLISLIAGFAVAITYDKTKANIEMQKKLTEENALKNVFPANTEIVSDSITDTLITESETTVKTTLKYWLGKNEDSLVGYAFKGSGNGYSGKIEFIVAVDDLGKILGLNILSQTETPGLGSRTQEVVSDLYIWNGLFKEKEEQDPWFTSQFEGLSIKSDIKIDKSSGEWHKMNEEKKNYLKTSNSVTAITGATISTKTVSKSVKSTADTSLLIVKNHLAVN